MLMFHFWGRVERGGDADICKYTRIRKTLNRFRNKNQLSTEVIDLAMLSFF